MFKLATIKQVPSVLPPHQ